LQLERLRGLGEWLKTSGEASFNTRPWWERAEGKTTDGLDVRFTRKGETLYVIVLGRPKGDTVTVESLPVVAGSIIQLLGNSSELSWVLNGNNLKINLPADRPDTVAYSFRISRRSLGAEPPVQR